MGRRRTDRVTGAGIPLGRTAGAVSDFRNVKSVFRFRSMCNLTCHVKNSGPLTRPESLGAEPGASPAGGSPPIGGSRDAIGHPGPTCWAASY